MQSCDGSEDRVAGPHELPDTEEVVTALADGRLSVAMQPIVDLATGDMVGREALVRWRHPVLGLLLPVRFLPQVEAAGKAPALDLFVLWTVCQRLSAERVPIRTSVNMSPTTLAQPGVAEAVLRVIYASSTWAANIQIEISEHATVAELAAARGELRQLRSAGVGILIDDFGAGATSLAHLGELAPYGVKIDRSLIAGLDRDVGMRKVIGQIVRLGAEFGFRTVAEGVEETPEAIALEDLGCQTGQGFLFGRPELASL